MTNQTPTTPAAMQQAITFEDVMGFVARNGDRLLPTMGGRTQFNVKREAKKLVFTPLGYEPRDETDTHLVHFLEHFNQSPSYKTTRFTKLTANASYLLGMFWEIIVEKRRLSLAQEIPPEEKEILSAPLTQQKALRDARKGQGQYRKKLLKLRGSCYITGLTDKDFLRASHIRPWADCTDNTQRLDEYNGLLLAPHYDMLFDKGHISFDEDGGMLVASSLSKEVIQAFALPKRFKGKHLGSRTLEYLRYHRDVIFRGPPLKCLSEEGAL